METIDVVVDRRRRRSAWPARPPMARAGPRGLRARAPSPDGHGHEHAQQRRHPRRHLLSAGVAEGPALRRGRARPLRLLRRHRVPHARCGKLIVALDEGERRRPRGAQGAGRRQRRRGARDWSIAAFIRRREPHAAGVAALFSPNTGHRRTRGAGARARARAARTPAGTCCRARALVGAERDRTADARCGPGTSRSSQGPSSTPPGCIADEVSAMLGGEPFRIYPCRGEYAELAPSRAHLVNALVYPLPERVGPRPRRAPDEDHLGQRPHRADGPPPGRAGTTTRRGRTGRSTASSSPRGGCCPD